MNTILIATSIAMFASDGESFMRPFTLWSMLFLVAIETSTYIVTNKIKRWQTMVHFRTIEIIGFDLAFCVLISISPTRYTQPLFSLFIVRIIAHYFVIDLPRLTLFSVQFLSTAILFVSYNRLGILPTILGGPWIGLTILIVTNFTGAALYLRQDHQRRNAFIQDQMLQDERQRSAELLRAILPESIADRLTNDRSELAEQVAAATVIFADLVGFAKLSRQLPARQIIGILSELFGEFDAAARKHGVEKIKTIGDGYMAAAGVPEICEDHVERALRFSLDVLISAENYRKKYDINIGVRIGVHTGPVVAGVLATHRLAYDLWGDTVNFASRLESSAATDTILVSEEVHAISGHTYSFGPARLYELKGIGKVKAYSLDHTNSEVRKIA